MILYVADEEYARRLLRYLSGRRRPGLQIERVTEREDFWQRRSLSAGDETLYWVTDDTEGCLRDPKETFHRALLAEDTDETVQQIGFCKGADVLHRELMRWMDISEAPGVCEDAPPQGVYALFGPIGEEASLSAALLTQELAEYGACAYVNLSAFPHFYMRGEGRENHRLGELFFRLECENYGELIREAKFPYGGAIRLPTVAHFRDLWDIDDRDRKRFFDRLHTDCHYPYVVVVFNDIREAMPMVPYTTRFLFMMRETVEPPLARWNRYAATEGTDAMSMVTPMTMPRGWEYWIPEMEGSAPETWLADAQRKTFAGRLWREEAYNGGEPD